MLDMVSAAETVCGGWFFVLLVLQLGEIKTGFGAARVARDVAA